MLSITLVICLHNHKSIQKCCEQGKMILLMPSWQWGKTTDVEPALQRWSPAFRLFRAADRLKPALQRGSLGARPEHPLDGAASADLVGEDRSVFHLCSIRGSTAWFRPRHALACRVIVCFQPNNHSGIAFARSVGNAESFVEPV